MFHYFYLKIYKTRNNNINNIIFTNINKCIIMYILYNDMDYLIISIMRILIRLIKVG